jgi:anti-sigma28 factor (negative regulator of flagellin synthesis)
MASTIADITAATAASVAVENASSTAAVAARVQSAQDAAKVEAPPKDAASFSPLSAMLTSATQAASAQQSIRTNLVAMLKSQIADGSHRPDPDAVAARVAAALKVS